MYLSPMNTEIKSNHNKNRRLVHEMASRFTFLVFSRKLTINQFRYLTFILKLNFKNVYTILKLIFNSDIVSIANKVSPLSPLK